MKQFIGQGKEEECDEKILLRLMFMSIVGLNLFAAEHVGVGYNELLVIQVGGDREVRTMVDINGYDNLHGLIVHLRNTIAPDGVCYIQGEVVVALLNYQPIPLDSDIDPLGIVPNDFLVIVYKEDEEVAA